MLKSNLYLVFPQVVCIVAYVAVGPEINGIKEKLRRARRHSIFPLARIVLSRAFIHTCLQRKLSVFAQRKMEILPASFVERCCCFSLVPFLVFF